MKNDNVIAVVEKGLGNPVKLRILRVLASEPGSAFTKYELEKRTYAKPVSLRKNLRELVSIGWVEELPYLPRKYRLNLQNEVLRHLLDFFKAVKYI